MGDRYVFISYATQDKAAAEEVCETLERAGSTCWIAPRDVKAGKLYPEEIIAALRGCRAVVLLLSSSSNKSPHIVKEIDSAFNRRLPILTLRVEDIEPSGALEYYLGGIQWLDGFSLPLKAHLARLCENVDAVLGAAISPPVIETHMRAAALVPPVVETSIRGFCLPWPANDRSSTEVRNAAALLTNVKSLPMAYLERLAAHCRHEGKALVLVAPTLESAFVKLTQSVGGLAIEAADLRGQPLDELLEDLGVYLGNSALLREAGFGLPCRSDGREKTDKGIFYPDTDFYDILVDCVASACEVRTDSHHTYFETEETPKLLALRENVISVLKYRARNQARSKEEFDGLNERLRRFGAVEPVAEHRIERVSFERGANEITLPLGFASRYFVTDMDTYECCIGDPKVLVTTCPLSDIDVIVPALEQAAEGLVVFAPRILEPALATMICNKLRGAVLSLAVLGCSAEELSAIASLTGAGLIDETNSGRLRRSSVRDLFGNARRVVAEIHKTTITAGE